MKSLISWLIVAAIGFALMAFSHFNYQYQPGPDTWKYAFMYIGKADPNSETEGLEYVKRPIRLLPISGRAQNFTDLARNFGSHIEKSYRATFQEKVILYSDITADFNDQMLELGRFPLPGADEVIAGYRTANKDTVTINGRAFKIAGQLKKNVRLFVDSYLICDDAVARELFNPDDEAVQNAYIFRLPKEQLTNPQTLQLLKNAFPRSQFATYTPLIQLQPKQFYLYIGGMTLLWLGGCLVLFRVYRLLADKVNNKSLRLPLAEIGKYRRLFLTLHLVYFGAGILFMLAAYNMPELQACLSMGVKSQVVDGSGPLGVVGKAYMSKSIPLAALATFAINFFLGSLAYITIPSVIIPGVGILAAVLRASIWGLLLAPNFDTLTGPMLPHSFTLLLEGEGYILATFFGLLVLVYLFRKAEGPSVARRYGKALLMNVRGNLLVAIVLAVAAIYEAIEVILMML